MGELLYLCLLKDKSVRNRFEQPHACPTGSLRCSASLNGTIDQGQHQRRHCRSAVSARFFTKKQSRRDGAPTGFDPFFWLWTSTPFGHIE